MGVALSVFDEARALHISRERFLPVKTTNDLLALWSDNYEFDAEGRMLSSRWRTLPPLTVDLDPIFLVIGRERRAPACSSYACVES